MWGSKFGAPRSSEVGKVDGEWSGHPGGTSAVVFLGEARGVRTFASGGADGKVRLWSVGRRGALLDVLERRREVFPCGHGAPVSSLSASYDGAELASASADKTVLVSDAAKLAPKLMLPHDKGVRWVAYPPPSHLHSTLLALAGTHGRTTLTKWDLRSGEAVARFSLRPAGALALAFFSNSSSFVVAEEGSATLSLFRWESETPVMTFKGSGSPICSMAACGKTVVGLRESGELTQVIEGTEKVFTDDSKKWEEGRGLGGRLSASPDGRLVSGGDRRGRVRVWEKAAGKLRASLVLPTAKGAPHGAVWDPARPAACLVFSPHFPQIHLWE